MCATKIGFRVLAIKLGIRILALNLFLIIVLIQNSAHGEELLKKSCASLLPDEAKEEIIRTYKNWRILEQDDLVSDDQLLWNKYHMGECPGIVVGTFDNSGKKAYAVLMITQAPIKKAKLLLIRKKYNGKYTITLFYSENNLPNFPVIHKGPPGLYYDFYNRKHSIEAKADVIIYEHIESKAIAFYYKNGKYQHLLISD
jgi:hypothetical protein